MFPLIPLPNKEATGFHVNFLTIEVKLFPLIPLPNKEATNIIPSLSTTGAKRLFPLIPLPNKEATVVAPKHYLMRQGLTGFH